MPCRKWWILSSIVAVSPLMAEPSKVQLIQQDGGWRMTVDNQPFFIQGAGGDGSKQLLKEIGGNAFRTWGVGEDTQAKLDEAQRLGLKVAVGIWLGHERHNFSYSNLEQVARQYEESRKWILRYKDHPALLCWGIGNEMEGFKDGDNAAIWSAVNSIATLAHQLDPNHPTMTTVAEIGGKRIEAIHRLCPDIDIIGINSYGGGPSLAKRYREAGGTKPFVLTEYGPAGTWEVGKNSWGVPLEQTSTQKAAAYRATYSETIASDGLCLGGFAFAWGNKQEATATWYGMFLPDGSRLEAIDTMRELWTGSQVSNRCPQIQPLVASAQQVTPGEKLHVKLDVIDPEGDALKATWILHKDPGQYETGGDAQPVPPSFPDAITKADLRGAELTMPQDPGSYWLYAYVRDSQGGAAVANLPLLVKGQAVAEKQPKSGGSPARLPVQLFADGAGELPYVWSGWMGNIPAIAMDEKFNLSPHSGASCMRCEYRAADNFGGIIWQSPANDWGDLPGGKDLTGAKKLTFWARGERGGEKVKFVYGILGKDKKHPDSAGAEREFTLTSEWKQYEFSLVDQDLSRIKTGFGWIVGGQGAPITFYLDDIQYE